MRLDLISNGILLEFRSVAKVVGWDEIADDYDPWEAMDQAEKVAADSGIRIGRDKDLQFIAIDESGTVVGAVWASLDGSDEGTVYDFDVAVDPKHRSGRIGLELIDAALGDYEYHKADDPNTYVRVWVVNPKLVRVLERRYNFDIESEYRDGSAHMVYHG